MRKRSSKKWLIIVAIIVAVVGLGLGVFFGARAIYNSGVEDGKRIESDESSERIHALGRAMQEKVEFQEKTTTTFGEIPNEINSDGINKYIENLEQLISNTTNESTKSALNEYLAKWQEFKQVYDSKDNDKITESFNALKATASDTATKIQNQYDEAIKSAIQNL